MCRKTNVTVSLPKFLILLCRETLQHWMCIVHYASYISSSQNFKKCKGKVRTYLTNACSRKTLHRTVWKNNPLKLVPKSETVLNVVLAIPLPSEIDSPFYVPNGYIVSISYSSALDYSIQLMKVHLRTCKLK